MGTTFSSAALTLDIRSLPMSSSVMAVGALAWVAQEAYASISSSSSSSSSPPVLDATAFKPVVLVTAGWALLYYAFLFDQSASAFVALKDARRAAKAAGRALATTASPGSPSSPISFHFFFSVKASYVGAETRKESSFTLRDTVYCACVR